MTVLQEMSMQSGATCFCFVTVVSRSVETEMDKEDVGLFSFYQYNMLRGCNVHLH